MEKPKINYLDGLRGFACMVVVADHWFLMGYNDPTSKSTSVLWEPWLLRSPLRIFVDGGFAVNVFLVLSGYVLLIKYLQSDHSTNRHSIYSGMIRRYPRLMIPGLIASMLYFSWLHFGPYQGYSGCHAVGEIINNQNGTISYDVGTMLLNSLIGEWTYEEAIYTPLWTLQVELIGSWIIYAVALGLVMLHGNHKLGAYFVLISLMPILSACQVLPLAPQYFQSFITGLVLAELEVSGKLSILRNHRKEHPREFIAAQVCLLLTALYCGTYPYQVTMGRRGTSMWQEMTWLDPWMWLTFAGGCLMLSLLTFEEFQWLMTRPVSHFLGTISFSVYLLHYQVLILADVLVMPYLGPACNPAGKSDRTAAAVICFLLLILPTVVCCSYLFTLYVDNTAIACARDFSDFWQKRFPVYCGCLKAKKLVDNTYEEVIKDFSGTNIEIAAGSPVVVPVQPNQEPLLDNSAHAQAGPGTCMALGIEWWTKKKIVLYLLVALIIIGSISPPPHRSCYIDDDNY